MNYFYENKAIDVAAFQLSHMSVDGREIYGVKHTERVIEGDYIIEQGENVFGRVYHNVVATDQLYERLKAKGLREMGYDDHRFLTQEELDTYIKKTVDEVEFRNAELERLKQAV
jgi:hypothetical protein